MDPQDLVEYVKHIGPWVSAIGDVVWYVLNDIVLKLLGILLIIARLTPTEADNKIINSMLSTVHKATGTGSKKPADS